jgi:hypothetical protein
LGRDELKAFLKDLQGKTSLDTRRKVQQVVHKVPIPGMVAHRRVR